MRRHPVVVVAIVLAVLTALWGFDAVTGSGIYWAHDLRHHHMPWRAWAASEWLAGRVPWWAPDVANGFPLLADGQAGILYPPTMLLFMVLPPALALNWSILLHTWWAGLGAFQLARAHKLRPEAALVGAIAFGFSGFLASHTVYLGMQNAVAWLPWALWAIMDRRWAWLGISTYMMAVAGHPQAAAFGLLLCGVTALWQRQYLPFALAVGVGLLAASPQLLATIQLTDFGMRQGGVDASFSNIGALPPQELLNMVLPDIFGHDTPADVLQTYYHRGNGYWGQGLNHWEMCFFLGVPTVVLAGLAALPLVGRRRAEAAGNVPRKAVLFWVLVGLFSVVLMLGNLGILWPILHRLPGLDGFRFPVRFSLVLTVAACVLAALGAQVLMLRDQASLRRDARWIATGAGLLLV
ncbi:MAG: YfhO family protein, partial [Oligoflexia bacterium]|nr:YfhO family protein [Oligoflexia bacterium]